MENVNYEGIDLLGEEQLQEAAENPVNTQLAKPAEELSEAPPESPEQPRESLVRYQYPKTILHTP